MPHLLIERLRALPKLCTFTLPSRRKFPLGAYLVEVLDIIAGVTFIVGSVYFLPEYSHNLTLFLRGCILYVIGAAIFCFICSFTVAEAVMQHGWQSFESWENGLYLAGSWVFLYGTFLYWPEKAHYEEIETLKDWSLGQYFNLFTTEFEGTILFILGSCMYAFAAFFNALSQHKFDDWSSHMLVSISSLYMGGSLLFAMGSIAFLPNLGCNETMVGIGAWMFIVGSCCYFIGGCLSFWRTCVMLGYPEEDIENLWKQATRLAM